MDYARGFQTGLPRLLSLRILVQFRKAYGIEAVTCMNLFEDDVRKSKVTGRSRSLRGEVN